MKTSKGIPCNETRHTIKARKSRITFRFVTNDGNTPSACTVGIGDTDPITGETITDMTFFREYYRMEDHDIYSYWKSMKPPLTPTEKEQHNEKKARIAADFEKQYGYRPSNADLRWITDDFMPERFTVSIERFRDEEDNPECDRIKGLGIPSEDPFAEDEPEDILRLREAASSLTGRLANVYEALLVKYAGGKEKITMTSLARKWGVSIQQIYKDRDRIIRMIRKAVTASQEADN